MESEAYTVLNKVLYILKDKYKTAIMDIRDITKATESTKRLVQDEAYYRHIFKKTEKIVSVIFYVSNSLETDAKNEKVIEDILTAARACHFAVLKTLEMRAHLAEDSIRHCAYTLIALDSQLRIASTLRLISPEVLHVIVTEIDTVLRGLNKYLIQTTAFDDLDYKVASSPVTSPPSNLATRQPSNSSTPDHDRRERIKVVLQAKGSATVKDISDIITDISSKTIQRELNTMIEDNLIKRQGERRWSKYSLN